MPSSPPDDHVQVCPLCGTPVSSSQRYPNYLCRECAAVVTTVDGVPVTLANAGAGGGFLMSNAETGEVLARAASRVLVRGVECIADEAHFGGIVIQPAVGFTRD